MTLVEPKENLFCPLTLQLFHEPVFAKDGHTYERQAIEKWFRTKQISPMTRQEITTELVPNYDKKTQIDHFHQKYKICTIGEFLNSIRESGIETFKKLSFIGTYLQSINFDEYPSLQTTTDKELVDVKNKHKSVVTALCLAADCGDLALCEELLKLGSNVNLTNGHLWTPLHLASSMGFLDVVELLLKNKANINALTELNYTPLNLTLSILSSYKKNCDNMLKVATLLINSGANVNTPCKNCSTPLHFAAQTRNLELVKLLIQKGAKIDEKNINDSSPIHDAIEGGSKEIFEELLNSGANITIADKQGMLPFHLSVKNNHLPILERLLNQNTPINSKVSKGNTGLHLLFIYKCHYTSSKLAVLNKLLEYHADPNCQNDKGETPFYLLTKFFQKDVNYQQIAQLLIMAGADCHIKDNNNVSAFDLMSDTTKTLVAALNSEYKVKCLKMPKFVSDLEKQILVLKGQVDELSKCIDNLLRLTFANTSNTTQLKQQ